MTQGLVSGLDLKQISTGSRNMPIEGSAWPWKLNRVSLSSGVPGGLASGAHVTPEASRLTALSCAPNGGPTDEAQFRAAYW